ncbi:uncharacterized protein LOC119085050 [Bradysia coprophila]|uniref:uncharacterized protein LOC119085050 n=1 Tax=Bradysia coprophila TaxID=38358 RepID=UPI00187DBEBE|nr:uncharacterized protein LOC119085050 [Bradysia coprophila]
MDILLEEQNPVERDWFSMLKEVVIPAPLKLVEVHAPTIEVYYWGPRPLEASFGHIALRLIIYETDEEIYISHWPKGQKTSLKYDVEAEGRDPDEYISIPPDMIYYNSVTRWWENARNGKYNSVSNNCAHVVYGALRSGCFPRVFIFNRPLVTPFEVKEWVKRQIG